MATYQVWYTKKNGEEMMAWQGLTYRKPGRKSQRWQPWATTQVWSRRPPSRQHGARHSPQNGPCATPTRTPEEHGP